MIRRDPLANPKPIPNELVATTARLATAPPIERVQAARPAPVIPLQPGGTATAKAAAKSATKPATRSAPEPAPEAGPRVLFGGEDVSDYV